MTGPYAQEWKEAILAEFKSLQGNGVWVLLKRPKNQHVIGCRWCFVHMFMVAKDRQAAIPVHPLIAYP